MKCYNCKNIRNDGTSCCMDQQNRIKYPDLKSPDYIFEEDYQYRDNLKLL